MITVSCHRCGRILTGPEDGILQPLGICVICAGSEKFKRERDFRRKTKKWIMEAQEGKAPKVSEEELWKPFRE